jgi:pSer/pThr/pTyr-binding forkhead associated (FHA) protein
MIMSGVEDGLMLSFNSEHNDGYQENGEWILTIGRREDSDIPLRNDTYISRLHARLHWSANCWWLEDCESKNGTFVDEGDDDTRVHGTVEVEPGQLFRIGRTWLRLQITE